MLWWSHGGKLRVRSKVGAGTTFSIDLPGKQEIINEWQQKFAVPAMATSAGGDGAGALGEAAAGGAIPGAQKLPLLGGAPV